MAEIKEKMKVRESAGAIICRKTDAGIPQVLMVKGRVQFAYREFVFGKYTDEASVMNLLNDMTVGEKLLLIGKDFGRIWYHIWLNIPTSGNMYYFYSRCRSKFERFTSDGGRQLITMIQQSKSIGDTKWGFPHGKIEIDESDLDGALRELYEEGNVSRDDVKILSTLPLTASHSTAYCKYRSRYFVMEAIRTITEGVSFENPHQYKEVSDVRWVSLADIHQLTCKIPDTIRLATQGLALYKMRQKLK
jgi:8-oxo-dGTP pyrophosphatase MutT (NUDIX family)